MKNKILIIDDDIRILSSLRNFLHQYGYIIIEAHDGRTALRFIEEQEPDLIISDMLLPGIAGLELCKIIKENLYFSKIPVFLMTEVYKKTSYRLESQNYGADAFIEKPINFQELLENIKKYLPFKEIDSNKSKSFDEELTILTKDFIEELPKRFKQLEKLLSEVSLNELNEEQIKEMHLIIHSLSGTAGTFSLDSLYRAANSFLKLLQEIIQNETPISVFYYNQIYENINQLKKHYGYINEINRLPLAEKQDIKANKAHNHLTDLESSIKNILIVDDEEEFALMVLNRLKGYSDYFNIITARNGEDAIRIINSGEIDLIITDLLMPIMDGFELLAYISNNNLEIPVIVMTAYGNSAIENKINNLGALQFIQKPIDFQELEKKILDVFISFKNGYINGVSLSSFLQLIEMEKKTCTLYIKHQNKFGILYFQKGILIDSKTDLLRGLSAALEIICWENPQIEIEGACRRKINNINLSLYHILMEAFKNKDEKDRDSLKDTSFDELELAPEDKINIEYSDSLMKIEEEEKEIVRKEIDIMTIRDKLQGLASLEGFGGVALLTPNGEFLALLEENSIKSKLKEIAVLSNQLLLNAQKTSFEMGIGTSQFIHFSCEKIHILARCYNEGSEQVKFQPGKAHFHLVLFLHTDDSIGLAKMRIESILYKLVEDFRIQYENTSTAHI